MSERRPSEIVNPVKTLREWRDQMTPERRVESEAAYFSPSWTPFRTDGGRDFSVIVDGVSV